MNFGVDPDSEEDMVFWRGLYGTESKAFSIYEDCTYRFVEASLDWVSTKDGKVYYKTRTKPAILCQYNICATYIFM